MPSQSSRNIGVDSNPKLAGIFDTVNAALATSSPGDFLPQAFFDPHARRIMETIVTEEEHGGFVESHEFRVLGIGQPLSETVARMEKVINHPGSESEKLALFACHDSTLAGMMTALGCMRGPNWCWPGYSAFLTIELFQYRPDVSPAQELDPGRNKDTNEKDRYVRLSFLGLPLSLPGCRDNGSHLAGAETFCTLVSTLQLR